MQFLGLANTGKSGAFLVKTVWHRFPFWQLYSAVLPSLFWRHENRLRPNDNDSMSLNIGLVVTQNLIFRHFRIDLSVINMQHNREQRLLVWHITSIVAITKSGKNLNFRKFRKPFLKIRKLCNFFLEFFWALPVHSFWWISDEIFQISDLSHCVTMSNENLVCSNEKAEFKDVVVIGK